jgi:transcriptional regulator with XRE-family HTH domain
MPLGFASEAVHIRDIGHLSTADIARATGVDDSTVRAWLSGSRTPSGERAERLGELSSVVERLARVIQAEYIPVWLRKPNALLDDESRPVTFGDGTSISKPSRTFRTLGV